LLRIQISWSRAVAEFGESHRVGPFVTTINARDDLVWMNYALACGTGDASDDVDFNATIAQLRELFSARRRYLRFEFIEPLWPKLAEILERAGLVLQARLPLMVCTRSERTSRPRADTIRIERLRTDVDDAALSEFLAMRDRGFGMSRPTQPTADQVREFREELADGRLRSVRAWIDDTLAGAGSLTKGQDVAELVGVVTDEPFRGRGVARAVSQFLVDWHLDEGGTAVWLSAGTDIARRVYERIGFREIASQLNYIDAAWKG
jgi:GNAT superfamily N-acetyltransferase